MKIFLDKLGARTRNPEIPLPDAFGSEANVAPSTQTRLVHSVLVMERILPTEIRTQKHCESVNDEAIRACRCALMLAVSPRRSP